jgi:hypothetical protein
MIRLFPRKFGQGLQAIAGDVDLVGRERPTHLLLQADIVFNEENVLVGFRFGLNGLG